MPKNPSTTTAHTAPKKTVKKYRPSLTDENILHILKLAKTESPISAQSLAVIKVLAPFLAKINAGAITPAYAASNNRQSLEEKLGLAPISQEPMAPILTAESMPKEQYWAKCYDKYKASPESCTLLEIEAAREHMYLNDLMSPEDMVAFERAAFLDSE